MEGISGDRDEVIAHKRVSRVYASIERCVVPIRRCSVSPGCHEKGK